MDCSFLIYGLVDPRDGQLRYVGKSCSGMNRPRAHGRLSSLKQDTHKTRWIRSLRSQGLTYRVVVLQESDKEILSQAEVFWIAYFRQMGCPLTNTAAGGAGGHGAMSSETKTKISERLRGNKNGAGAHRPGTGAAISAAKVGSSRLDIRGIPRTPEVRAKIRAAHLGTRHDAERILANSRRQGGKAFVDERGSVFLYVSQASRDLNLQRANVTAVLKGRRKSTGGHTFRYLE